MSKFQKPSRLRDDDKVAIVSPSRTLPSVFPRVAERGIENIRRCFHLNPVILTHAFDDLDRAYKHPEERASDVNSAFGNPEIKGLISTIGGDDSIRVLKYLDQNLIRNNVKIFTGFSDCTTITSMLYNMKIASIYGGSVMAGFAQMENLPPEFISYWDRVLKGNSKGIEMRKYKSYSEGYPEWKTSSNPGNVNPKKQSPDWKWITGDSMQGRVFAANIEVLDWLRGTEYFPELNLLKDSILLLETSEEVPSPLAIQRMVRNLGQCDVLEKVSGIAFGRFRGYDSEMRHEVMRLVRSVLETENSLDTLPLVEGIDFGHTDPYFPIPVGTRILIEGDTLTFLESFAT